MKTVIFLGPTLEIPWARTILSADYLQPARQGDIYRTVRDRRPWAIGLVDGVFLDAPAVWHREILWAMTQGVHMFGAASMGALRAAELAAYGMRGVGRVFEAYRDGHWPGCQTSFEDDDEVAVIHAPAEAGSFALSDAMVDLRDTLLAAKAAAVISGAQCDELTDQMKRRHFSARSFAELSDVAGPPLADWIDAHAVRRKRLDAEAMLHRMAEFLAEQPPPFRAEFRFTEALVWQSFVTAADAQDRAAMKQALWDDWLPTGTER